MTIDLHNKWLKISFLWELAVKILGTNNFSIKNLPNGLKTMKIQLKSWLCFINLTNISIKCVLKLAKSLKIQLQIHLYSNVISLACHVHQYLCRCMEPAVLELWLPKIRCERNHRRREVLATNSCCMTKEYDKWVLDWKNVSCEITLRPKFDSLLTYLLSLFHASANIRVCKILR